MFWFGLLDCLWSHSFVSQLTLPLTVPCTSPLCCTRYPNSYALVVSTENITQNYYKGNQRSMLIPNCIFRIGGAAMILSNRRGEAWRAKYELQHVVRTILGANDHAYGCVMQEDDAVGITGIHLSKVDHYRLRL
jgi:FAE1/Type III polyketide synthase-like protein